MLLSPDARDTATAILTPDDFDRPAHQHIYAAITTLHDRGEPVDPGTVADILSRRDQLDQIGPAGAGELVAIQSDTPATSSAARYARIVLEHAVLRAAINEAHQLAEHAYTVPEDVEQLRPRIALLERIVDRAAARRAPVHIGALIDQWIPHQEAKAAGDTTAIPTGLHDLDAALGGGLHPGQLIVIAGRTSMGKTVFGGQIALNVARAGHPAFVCSVEMAALELADRWVASESRIHLATIRHGVTAEKDWDRVLPAAGEMSTWPLWIEDRDDLTVDHIRTETRALPTPPAVIVVDYIQILTAAARGENRQTEVAAISAQLKRLARRLEIPIVALAQLNRGAEARHEKRPMLADLRESGAIENDADVVIGLYRDEYYNRDSADRGVIEAHILKQRNGPLVTVRLAFLGEINSIRNMARPSQQEELTI